MSSRAYRFAEPDEPGSTELARCSTRSCRTCGASALASCIALCCCPCAAVSCCTLALVKAPYMAGRRCVKLVMRQKGVVMRRKEIRSLEERQEESSGATERPTKGWGELGQAGSGNSSVANDGEVRRFSSRMDVEKVWMEMYQFGHWGFGRVSFSAAGGAQVRGSSEKDGNAIGQLP